MHQSGRKGQGGWRGCWDSAPHLPNSILTAMIGSEGAGRLAGMLGQCSSLAVLHLRSNDMAAEGAGRLAGVLGQCCSLLVLNIGYNCIEAEGAGRLVEVLGQCSSLAVLNLGYNGIDDDGIAILRACWPEVSGLDDQFDEDDQFF